MKRIVLVAAIIIAAFLLFFYKSPAIPQKNPVAVSVTIDTGMTVATVSGVMAKNAYQALQGATAREHLALKSKQYSFGVFVEQIGTFANSNTKAWIYFVNGKAGTVAADKQSVVNRDMVEWQYTTPSSE